MSWSLGTKYERPSQCDSALQQRREKMSLSVELMDVRVHRVVDEDPDLSWLTDEGRYEGVEPEERAKYMDQDLERLQQYGDTWQMLGVYVEARLRFKTPQGGWQSPFRVRTAGLWGIESDSEEEYFDSVADEEMHEMLPMLQALGVEMTVEELKSKKQGSN